jgi:hypothetical protein
LITFHDEHLYGPIGIKELATIFTLKIRSVVLAKWGLLTNDRPFSHYEFVKKNQPPPLPKPFNTLKKKKLN